MKTLPWITLLFCSFFANYSVAQTIKVIDYSGEEWDEYGMLIENPWSLASLLKTNFLHNIEGMRAVDTNVMYMNSVKEIEMRDPFAEPLMSVLYPSEDSTRCYDANMKEVSCKKYGKKKGVERYTVYPEPDKRYYDLEDFSRVILIYDTVQHELTREKYYGIKEIAFAKQYGTIHDKYVITLKLNYRQLIEMDAFKAVERIPDEVFGEISNLGTDESLIRNLWSYSEAAYELDTTLSVLDYANNKGQYMPKCVEYFYPNYPPNWWDCIRPSKLWDYARQGRRPEETWRAFDHAYPKMEWPMNPDFGSESNYGSLVHDTIIYPTLKNPKWIEAMDPYTGERPETYDELIGDYVTYSGDIEFYWADIDLESAYVLWDCHADPDEHYLSYGAKPYRIQPEALIFNTSIDGIRKPVPAITIRLQVDDEEVYEKVFGSYRYFDFLKDMRRPFYDDYRFIPWRDELMKLSESAPTYDLNNPEDIKKLSEEFHLPSCGGVPINLLDVVPAVEDCWLDN